MYCLRLRTSVVITCVCCITLQDDDKIGYNYVSLNKIPEVMIKQENH